MTTKHMTVKQLEAEITKLENNIDKEIDVLHLLLDKGNDLVGEAFTFEDELFELRDTFEEMKTRLAKSEAKSDNMKGRKTKVAPPVPVDLTKYVQQFIENERSKKTKTVPKKKTKTVPKKKTTPKKRSKK